jgi:hypothetical protein
MNFKQKLLLSLKKVQEDYHNFGILINVFILL